MEGSKEESDLEVCGLVAEDEKRDFDLKTTGGGGSSILNQGEVSLREWLDRPGRPVDYVECLHIFKQVVEAVNHAHHQGVVVNNIRPSCFVMSTFNCVSFIESASSSTDSDSDSSFEEEGGYSCGAFESPVNATQLSLVEEMKRRGELSELSAVGESRDFPLKKFLSMEFNWYKSTEETQGKQSVVASDVYKLGVLLFEVKKIQSCVSASCTYGCYFAFVAINIVVGFFFVCSCFACLRLWKRSLV